MLGVTSFPLQRAIYLHCCSVVVAMYYLWDYIHSLKYVETRKNKHFLPHIISLMNKVHENVHTGVCIHAPCFCGCNILLTVSEYLRLENCLREKMKQIWGTSWISAFLLTFQALWVCQLFRCEWWCVYQHILLNRIWSPKSWMPSDCTEKFS